MEYICAPDKINLQRLGHILRYQPRLRFRSCVHLFKPPVLTRNTHVFNIIHVSHFHTLTWPLKIKPEAL